MLTDKTIKSLVPGEKKTRHFDAGGLYLEVAPSGGKWWRLKFRYGGKEKRLSLGTYPTVSLREARERRDGAKKMLANGIDPSAARKEEKAEARAASETFEVIAREWHGSFLKGLTERSASEILHRIERDVFP